MRQESKKPLGIRVLILFFVFLMGRTAPASAHLFRLQSESLFSVRSDVNHDPEFPFYEFVDGSFISQSHNLELNTNFGAATLAEPKFSLYILDAAYHPIDDMTLRAGRSFNVRTSTRTMVTDSVTAEKSFFERHMKAGTMLGLERKRVGSTWDSTAHFAGAYADYQSSESFPLFVSTKYMFRRPETIVGTVDQHLLSLSMRKPLGLAWSPELLANSEYDASGAHNLNLGEMGLDLYPSYGTAFRWRGLTYNIASRNEIEEPIFSIFSMGRLYETSGQMETMINKSLVMSLALAYDNYVLQTDDQTNGYRVEWGSKIFLDFLNISNSVYFFKSYGGSVYGDRVKLTKDFSDRLEGEWASDVSYYEKITSSKTFAFSNEAWLSFWLLDHFKLNTGVELDSNNTYRYDFRVAAKLTYILRKEL